MHFLLCNTSPFNPSHLCSVKINSQSKPNNMNIKLLLILITTCALCFPKIHFGQAPTLGTTADFVLFSSVGAVTNTGITHLTGNVGTNSGSSTGFGNVDGTMNDGDLVSGQCAADLLFLYADLSAAIPTFFPAPLLGNGQILVPGVYSIPSPATMNLELILDGQNDPNSLFIIQIGGAFSTNANSKVTLINGALACNVFWKVEGLVDMAANSTMRGTIVANNAAINMGSGDELEGRALSINGAITVNNVLAYKPIGCGSPLLTGPIAPNLVSAACYAIFSSDGPVSNVGITNVTGDVGTNLGLTTGYNPLLVNGNIHPIPDGSTVACASDLLNAYTYLNTLPYEIELLYPAQFGNSLVLTPHTYIMNGAVTFTDTVFLNGQNNPDAVFVIQINGALATSTYSNVVLLNGTQSKNVYWKVDGAVDINDYSIFRGTIVCNNGAMSLNTGVILDGRALTTTGALNTSAVAVSIPSSCSPVTITEPTNQIACEGDSTGFTVIADGVGLTYQWRKGTVDLVNGGTISGANSATLSIDPVTLTDAGSDYNVVIIGTYSPSDTSENVSLTINAIPVITLEPTDQVACIGTSVTFTSFATGTGLSYQWRKGNVNLVNAGSISGTTSNSLTINPVTALDVASDYNVIVSGACLPSDTSNNVSLTVDLAPSIITEPTDQTICAGNSASFSVTAIGTGLTYQWRKGNVTISNGGSFSGANSSTLTINPATISDPATNYNVIVSGTCGSNDTSVFVALNVNTSPIIITEPVNQTACTGTSVSFDVTVVGTGLTYQWRKGNVNLINGGSISGANSNTVTINPVLISDISTNYNVIVSGVCMPNDTSVFVSLDVNSTLSINTQPVNITTCEGNTVSFIVGASGAGLSYQWRKGSVDLINGGNVSGVTNDTLTFTSVDLSDNASTYNVVILGTCAPSDTSINVTLLVNPVPVAVAASNSPICTGTSIEMTADLVVGATYNWSGPNSYSSTDQNPIIDSSETTDAGNYSLTITENGCISTTTVIAVVVNICNADLSITKSVDIINPFMESDVVFTIIATNNGAYDATGVAVSEILQSGYSFVSSTVTTGSYDLGTGIWTIGAMTAGTTEMLQITATVKRTGNYVNTVVIYGNEIDTTMANNVASIEPIPSDFFIPEGFSPNDDAINDLFVIRGILSYPTNSFAVFNRWGEKVFEETSYMNTWDGKATKGLIIGDEDLPAGTYFYILDLGNGSDIYKGSIYLNR